jgi:hypothetical protein
MDKTSLNSLKTKINEAIDDAYRLGWNDRGHEFLEALGAKAKPEAKVEAKPAKKPMKVPMAVRLKRHRKAARKINRVPHGMGIPVAKNLIMETSVGMHEFSTSDAAGWTKSVGIGAPTTWLALRRLKEAGFLIVIEKGLWRRSARTYRPVDVPVKEEEVAARDTTVSNSGGIEIFRDPS